MYKILYSTMYIFFVLLAGSLLFSIIYIFLEISKEIYYKGDFQMKTALCIIGFIVFWLSMYSILDDIFNAINHKRSMILLKTTDGQRVLIDKIHVTVVEEYFSDDDKEHKNLKIRIIMDNNKVFYSNMSIEDFYNDRTKIDIKIKKDVVKYINNNQDEDWDGK